MVLWLLLVVPDLWLTCRPIVGNARVDQPMLCGDSSEINHLTSLIFAWGSLFRLLGRFISWGNSVLVPARGL